MPFPKRDYAGQTFDRLTVIEDAPRRDATKHRCVLCACTCGSRPVLRLQDVLAGRVKSCGCLNRELRAARHAAAVKPVDGLRFGRLVVVAREPSRINARHVHVAYVRCACDCGRETVVQLSALRSHQTISCGCYQRDERRRKSSTHGMSHARIYRVWNSMIQRCTNPKNPAYHHYGGRGITVDPAWRVFATFHQDMGDKPSPEMSLDRIDNNGPYSKANCRWASRTTQAANRELVTREQLAAKDAEIAALKAELAALRATLLDRP